MDVLGPVSELLDTFKDTCLAPAWSMSDLTYAEQLASNSSLFSGGSAPRDVWAEAGLGATIDAHVVATDQPLTLIDLCSMTANTILGINDPWVKLKQISYLLSSRPHYLSARFGNDLVYRVARRLLEAFADAGSPADYVVNLRQCNGSDAIELALHAAWKAAEAEPLRRNLASFEGSYHGESLTANWISEHQPGRLLADSPENVRFFPVPETDDDGALTRETEATLELLERDGDTFFAVIVEPIQWRNSVHTIPLEFLRRLREVCTKKSICLVFDEMQNAFGYTGSITYAQTSQIYPDISAISKALTSGHGSLAVMVARSKYAEIETPFGAKSNSGNMLALVAVDAVLDRLLGVEPNDAATLPHWLPAELVDELTEGLLPTAYQRAVTLVDEMLTELCRRFPTLIGEPRGVGLVRGLVMLNADGQPSSALAAAAAKVCLAHGAYARQADTAVLFKPCIVIDGRETSAALKALTRTFCDVLRMRDGAL